MPLVTRRRGEGTPPPPPPCRADRRRDSRDGDYLRARQGRDFFLALAPFANALYGRPAVREIVTALEDETRQALERFAGEQEEMIEEAKAMRLELAERAPEVDNSDMERLHPASHDRAKYDLDSFANFDRLADGDVHVG